MFPPLDAKSWRPIAARLCAALLLAIAPVSANDAIELRWAHADEEAVGSPARLARVSGDAAYYLTSGSVPAPADPDAEPGDPARYSSSMEQQARSTLFSLAQNLAQAGLTPRDVAFLRVYLVTDDQGQFDAASFWSAYQLFFGTPENPNRPPVSLVPIPALALPGLRIEIEWVAAGTPGTMLQALAGVDATVTNPQVVTLAGPGSFIARGKLLRPQTALYFASGNIPAPANPEAPIGEWRIEGDVYEQSKSALARIEQGLRARGLSFADVVFLRCFLVDDPEAPFGEGSPFAEWNRAYAEAFNHGRNPNRPARTTVMVPPFDIQGMAIEIEVVAAYPDAAGPFAQNNAAGENPNLIHYGPEAFPIAEGKAVARRAPVLWSGTLLPSNPGASVTAQSENVLEQARTLLEAEGLDMGDITFLRVYGVPDADSGVIDRPGWDRAYGQFFGTESQPDKPARTFLPVPTWAPGIQVAIDFVAAARD